MKRDSFNAFLIALLVGFALVASYFIFSSKGEKKNQEPPVVVSDSTSVRITNRVVRDDVQVNNEKQKDNEKSPELLDVVSGTGSVQEVTSLVASDNSLTNNEQQKGVTMVTVASKKQRQTELEKKIAEAMKANQ